MDAHISTVARREARGSNKHPDHDRARIRSFCRQESGGYMADRYYAANGESAQFVDECGAPETTRSSDNTV